MLSCVPCPLMPHFKAEFSGYITISICIIKILLYKYLCMSYNDSIMCIMYNMGSLRLNYPFRYDTFSVLYLMMFSCVSYVLSMKQQGIVTLTC